jgi:hypothetical protein
MRVLVRSTIVAALTLSLAGCVLGEGEEGDLIYLHNTTDRPVTVTREVVRDDGPPLVFSIAEVDPGESGLFAKAEFDETNCLPGSLVARSGDVVVDEAAGLCRPVRWEIGLP